MGCPFSQGIGLRPQPWAGISRPVGPVGRFSDRLLQCCEPRPSRSTRVWPKRGEAVVQLVEDQVGDHGGDDRAIPPSSRAIRTVGVGPLASSSTTRRNPSVQLRAIRTATARAFPDHRPEVAIPPYSSGQFGLRASQALDSRPLSRPFWITSEIRLAFHLRTSPFQLAPLRLNAWISWSYGHPDNLPVKMAFWAWHDSWLAHPPPGATLVKEPEEQDTPSLPLYDTERRGFVGRDSQEEDGLSTTTCPRGV